MSRSTAAYFGGTVRQENRKEDRKDRRLAENQTGKRRVVVVMRERGGRTLPFVFRSEDEAVPTIRAPGGGRHHRLCRRGDRLGCPARPVRDPSASTTASRSRMVWTAPERHLCAKLGAVERIERKGPSTMKSSAKAVPTTIGLDIAKNFFQVHAVDAAGKVVLRRKLSRGEVLRFFEAQPKMLVGIEACGTGHYWAREIAALGHEVRLLPPTYVKPYVKRGKTDAADAEAICEAVTRPNMHFVPIKTAEQQAALMMHRPRELLVGQRTALVNALRGHLAELGIVTAKEVHRVADLRAELVGVDDRKIRRWPGHRCAVSLPRSRRWKRRSTSSRR